MLIRLGIENGLQEVLCVIKNQLKKSLLSKRYFDKHYIPKSRFERGFTQRLYMTKKFYSFSLNIRGFRIIKGSMWQKSLIKFFTFPIASGDASAKIRDVVGLPIIETPLISLS